MKEKNPAAVALGSIKSEKKATAARENGKLGGRPYICKACLQKFKTRDEKFAHMKTHPSLPLL